MTDLKPIKAAYHPSAFERVTRTFSSSPESIIGELLQNARRSGATRTTITIQHRTDENRTNEQILTISDNGCGIADPAVLLSYGQNGWDETTIKTEDAAGMGILSLAQTPCIITSIAAGGTRGFTLQLQPEHFRGEKTAHPVPITGEPGTKITFDLKAGSRSLINIVEDAARYNPMPVFLQIINSPNPHCSDYQDLKRVPQSTDFLANAQKIDIETIPGVRMGVFDNDRRNPNDDTNFHGHTLDAGIAELRDAASNDYSVKIDIIDCAEIQLTLPARDKIIQNDFYAKLKTAAMRLIYEFMAAQDDPQPTREIQIEASKLGITIPDPAPRLTKWLPEQATGYEYRYERNAPVTDLANAVIIDTLYDPPLANSFARALKNANAATRFYAPNPRLDGIPWYDALPRATVIDVEIKDRDNDKFLPFDEYLPAQRGKPMRPAEIAFLPLDTREDIPVPVTAPYKGDVLIHCCDKDCLELDDTDTIVTKETDLHVDELENLYFKSLFDPSTDYDCDSYETQEIQFNNTARQKALSILASPMDARLDAIRRTLREEVLYQLDDTIPEITITLTTKPRNIQIEIPATT